MDVHVLVGVEDLLLEHLRHVGCRVLVVVLICKAPFWHQRKARQLTGNQDDLHL